MELSNATVKHLTKLGFKGTDVSLKISLLEYDFICRETDVPNEVQVIFYNPSMDKFVQFGYTFVTESDVNEAYEQCKDTINSCCDLTEAEWYKSSLMQRISDIKGTVSWFDWTPCFMKSELINFSRTKRNKK